MAAAAKPRAQAVRFLADFGALAAVSQARLHELLHDQDEWLAGRGSLGAMADRW